MEGFIVNKTGKAVFKAQRPLPPGAKISLDKLYISFEKKSGKKKGKPFVKWLKENIFVEEGWLFFKEEGVPYIFGNEVKPDEPTTEEIQNKQPKNLTAEKVAEQVAQGAGRKLTRKNTKIAKSNNTVSKILEATPSEAKEIINQTKDRQTLKKALALSNHFSNKEEHRRLLQGRLDEVY